MAHHQNEGAWDRAQRDGGDDPVTAVEDRRPFREMVEHDGGAAEEAGDRGKQIRRAPKSTAGPAKGHCFKGAKEGRDRRQPPSSLSLCPARRSDPDQRTTCSGKWVSLRSRVRPDDAL